MRILFVHNHYGDGVRGGEEGLVRKQAELLSSQGHVTKIYFRKNSEFTAKPFLYKVSHFRDLIWSRQSYMAIQGEINAFRPDVMHVHNYWMVLSPSIFRAAHDLDVPVVLNINNYRLVCPGGLMLRKGRPCELCVGKDPWRVIVHRCCADNRMASLSIYLMHRQWLKEDVPGRDIDAFLCPTSFLREKIAANGIPPDRIHVVPEFVPDPVHGTEPDRPGSGAIVVGRLSGEKGLHTLMHAWSGIDYPLTVIGTGPLLPELQRMAPANVRFADFVSDAELNEYYRKAAFMVFASECYEGFGSVLLEAMAWGKPIVATDLGGRRHIIAEEGGGLLYAPHDAADLRRKVETLISSPARIVELGRRARRRFLKEFSGEAVYGRLLACYRAAMNR